MEPPEFCCSAEHVNVQPTVGGDRCWQHQVLHFAIAKDFSTRVGVFVLASAVDSQLYGMKGAAPKPPKDVFAAHFTQVP